MKRERKIFFDHFKVLFAGLLFLILIIPQYLKAQELEKTPQRPFIWARLEDKQAILNKIQTSDWAGDIFQEFFDDVDKSIKDHESDPIRFLKGLPFNWSEAKEGEVPPFYKTYHLVNGEQRNLDNATDEEYENAETLIRYLQIALDCGIAYYLVEDDRYAQCASDILNAFTKGVLQSALSDWHHRGGWLFPYDGFREVRVIGYKAPLIYDFIYPFLKHGGKPMDIMDGKYVDFPFQKAQQVFRTYADITVNYGHAGSNHSILEAPSLVYNALAMDDKTEREELLGFFLDKNTDNQDALNVMAAVYENEGDIWPETSQYLNAAASILTRLMFIVNRYDNSLHLGQEYKNILYALPALDYFVYPNGELIRWGDGKRRGSPPYKAYEEAYLLAESDNLEKVSDKFGALINEALKEGKYEREGIESVLWYVDEYDASGVEFTLPRADYIPHAGISLQRNLSKSNDPTYGLMGFVGGGHMVHGHAEGMNIELYGLGEVLGVDHGRGRYQQEIHENYSRIFAAHNTIIVNGSSRSDSGWVNLGINTVQLETMEPLPRQTAVSPLHSFSLSSFVDDKGDKAEAYQERLLAVVRTSDTSGYYLDVFRSRSALPNQYHDYLYHNIGDTLVFMDQDINLSPDPERYQKNAGDPWVQNRQYRHPGWHYFEDVRTSGILNDDVQARFLLHYPEKKDIQMNLFIPGFDDREYTRVLAPHTFEAPQPYDEQPTPTLLIRKSGEAWDEPFAVVFEPSFINSQAIEAVEKLDHDGKFMGLSIKSQQGDVRQSQLLLFPQEHDIYQDKKLGVNFKGTFGVVSLDEDGELLNAYMGAGHYLEVNDLKISANEDQKASVFIDFTTSEPVVRSNGKVEVRHAKKKIQIEYIP